MAEEAVEYVCVCHSHWISQPSGKSTFGQSAQLGKNQDIIYLMLESDKGHKAKYISGIENFHVYEINE